MENNALFPEVGSVPMLRLAPGGTMDPIIIIIIEFAADFCL
jgi:hypothetical protein